MPNLQTHPRYHVGDQVRLKFGARLVGTIIEVQGTHSPDGRILYSVRIPLSPEPLLVPVREDEIEKT